MYSAPGYFSDQREMDAIHAQAARADLDELRSRETSLPALLRAQLGDWSHGQLGQSRHFGIPVAQLLRERGWFSARLLVSAVAVGWLAALLLSIPLSATRSSGLDLLFAGLTALCLAVPVGALATVSLVSGTGGPVSVLALAVAVRDFKLLHRLLQSAWRAPHILHAQAQGFSLGRILFTHILPKLRRELLGLSVTSFTLALSALVPVEVIFDCPGVGQLAWIAAMNRDLPVLVAVTALVAACIGVIGSFVEPQPSLESTSCA